MTRYSRLRAILLAFLLIAWFAATPARAQETMTLTLQRALALARDNSQRIRQATADVRRAELAVREAQYGRLPTLSVDAQYANNVRTPVIFLPEGSPFGNVLRIGSRHNFNASAAASMPIYNARLDRSIELSKAMENLNEAILSVTEREVEIEVQRAYLNGLMTREALAVLRESYETRLRNLELVRALCEEGVSPEYDLIRTEVQVENIQPEVVRAENDHEGALNYIKLLTGISMETRIELDGSLEEMYAALPEIVVDPDFEQNAGLIQIEAQREIAERQLALERAAYLPSLSSFGQYTYQSQSNHLRVTDYYWVNTAMVGLTLSIPILGPQRGLRVQQAKVDLDKIDMQREYLLESIEAEFRTTTNRIAQVRQTIAAQERNVEQAERGLNIARVSYENGVFSVVEVNDAELALTQARLNQATAYYEYVNAVLDLENLLGRSIGS